MEIPTPLQSSSPNRTFYKAQLATRMKKKPSSFKCRDFLKSSAAIPSFSLFYFAGSEEVQAVPENPTLAVPLDLSPSKGDLGGITDPRFDGEPHMQLQDLECDLLIAGGGPSGVYAALAAAPNGAKVILVQRPVQCSMEIFSLLSKSLWAYVFTEGYFDIAWEKEKTPGIRLPDCLYLDSDMRTVFFRERHLKLDFGGFGKGYALDQMVFLQKLSQRRL